MNIQNDINERVKAAPITNQVHAISTVEILLQESGCELRYLARYDLASRLINNKKIETKQECMNIANRYLKK
jgi:hypothetical protein